VAAKLPPPAHTPLLTLPTLVLALQSTGHDVRHDRLLRVAAVAMRGGEIEELPPLELTIDPGQPIPPVATRMHGLRDQDVAAAPPFVAVAQQLFPLFAGRIVIGHHLGFDLGLLRFEAGRAGILWQEPMMLDLALVFGALHPELPELSLETVTATLDVPLEGQRSALTDCRAVAAVWSRLLPRLRAADIRTLAEVQTFAARRSDLRQHQMQMGWFDEPGTLDKVQRRAPHTRIDSYAFELQLGDLMRAPPRTIAADATLRTAAAVMVEHHIGALLVGRPEQPPVGILTERDLLRAIAGGTLDLDRTSASAVMSAPVQTMAADEMLYRALGRMDRVGIRHICIVDHAGIAVGMISQRDLLHHRARGVDLVEDALDVAEDLPALAAAYGRMPDIAGRLFAEDLDGPDVARVVSAELCTLTARAAEIAAAELEREGRGPAPAQWCLLVLGSGGRGESLLGADQDNALIHAGSDADDPWFAAFGARIADLLDRAGVPLCKGDVMASSADWRGTRAAWHARIDTWVRRAKPEDLLNCVIFFDLSPVAGDLGLGHELHGYAVQQVATSVQFIGFLAQAVDRFAPRLGLFGSLRVEEGRVDLKRDGLLSLTGLARTLALRAGSTARSTPERLRDASIAGRLPQGDADALVETHRYLLTLALRQQLTDLQEGVSPSSRVEWKALSHLERSRLKQALKGLDDVIKELRSMVTG
jgi:DNA polymerase-3 subunit epsilon/CBS domain-containing protein